MLISPLARELTVAFHRFKQNEVTVLPNRTHRIPTTWFLVQWFHNKPNAQIPNSQTLTYFTNYSQSLVMNCTKCFTPFLLYPLGCYHGENKISKYSADNQAGELLISISAVPFRNKNVSFLAPMMNCLYIMLPTHITEFKSS